MARLNLTIPDPLYERLERLRDRVNVSKVCAVALAKELDMLEGSSTMVADPRVRRMIERLQGQKIRKDRWFQHGFEDGGDWAADVAEAHELRSVLEEWDLDEDEQFELDDVEFPDSFDQEAAVERWLATELSEEGSDVLRDRLRAALKNGLDERDQDAYVRGWHKAVKELWNAASPSLRWAGED